MDKKQGRLIVIDGIDGSGKTTQIELLKKNSPQKGTPFEAISFPRYDSFYGQLIKRYLGGEFGSMHQVSPYLIALAYASDRLLAKPLIESWLTEGKLVIANRYVSSSKAHLGANLDEEKREEFMKWLDELEYKINRLPKEDLTILLTVGPKVGQENALKDHQMDMHEKSIEHEEKTAKIYFELSKMEENWVVVECMENGQMKSKEDIHQEIMQIVLTKLDLQTKVS